VTGNSLGSDLPGPPSESRRSGLPCGSAPSGNTAAQCPSSLRVDPRLFGVGPRTLLWLSVTPAHLEEAGAALARHPEIAFAAATTGPTNLYATVVCANQRELYRYLTTRVATLPAITHIETAPVIRTVKQAANRT
jgi:DNA-binding Lrp family transcriptional regulator